MSRYIFVILTFCTCMLLLTPSLGIAQFPEDGVVGYWSFDAGTINGGKVQDVLGKNDGELDGNPKTVNGKVDKALEFNGENFVHIPGSDTLDFNGAEAITVAAWINADSDSPVVGVVAGCCGTIVAQRDVNGWAIRFDGRNGGSELEFITMPGWQGDGGFGVPVFPKGEWHHLVGIVDGNKKYIYADGKLAKEENYNGPMQTGGTEHEIGKASDGGFVGLIDEVVIYNKALSEKEVKMLYEAEGLPVEARGKLTTRWAQMKASFQ